MKSNLETSPRVFYFKTFSVIIFLFSDKFLVLQVKRKEGLPSIDVIVFIKGQRTKRVEFFLFLFFFICFAFFVFFFVLFFVVSQDKQISLSLNLDLV